MINIDNKFDIGQTVYLVTDIEVIPRIVTNLLISRSEIIYEVFAGTVSSKHYDFEMTEEKPVFI